MAKTLTIRIKPIPDALENFRATFRALEGTGRKVPRTRHRDEVFFSSIEATRKLLTPTRLARAV